MYNCIQLNTICQQKIIWIFYFLKNFLSPVTFFSIHHTMLMKNNTSCFYFTIYLFFIWSYLKYYTIRRSNMSGSYGCCDDFMCNGYNNYNCCNNQCNNAQLSNCCSSNTAWLLPVLVIFGSLLLACSCNLCNSNWLIILFIIFLFCLLMMR